jgi:hypothetical protein
VKASAARLPEFVEPMKAKLVGSIPSGGDWLYEIKFDGYRALALRGDSETRILSRNQNDLGSEFPEVKDSIAALDIEEATIDDEIVALDEKAARLFNCSKESRWAKRNRQSSTTRSICSGSTAKPSRSTDRRAKGKTGRTVEKAAERNSLFRSLLPKTFQSFWKGLADSGWKLDR